MTISYSEIASATAGANLDNDRRNRAVSQDVVVFWIKNMVCIPGKKKSTENIVIVLCLTYQIDQ